MYLLWLLIWREGVKTGHPRSFDVQSSVVLHVSSHADVWLDQFRDSQVWLLQHPYCVPYSDTVTLSFQIIQEVEKQRIDVLCNILSKYNLHMASFRHTLVHVSVLPKITLNYNPVTKTVSLISLLLLTETETNRTSHPESWRGKGYPKSGGGDQCNSRGEQG
jgi:hypothetical protein